MDTSSRIREAKEQLDAHVRGIIQWHFDPETGCAFWLEFASKLGWDPRRRIQCFEDLRIFPPFEDEWLRGGMVLLGGTMPERITGSQVRSGLR